MKFGSLGNHQVIVECIYFNDKLSNAVAES